MRSVFVENIYISLRSTVCRWWADNQEDTLKDLARQAEALLHTQRRPRKTAENNALLPEVVRQSNKDASEREKPRCVMAPRNNGTETVFDKHVRSLEHTSARVVNLFMSAASTRGDESNSTYIDSCTYCRPAIVAAMSRRSAPTSSKTLNS